MAARVPRYVRVYNANGLGFPREPSADQFFGHQEYFSALELAFAPRVYAGRRSFHVETAFSLSR